MSGSDDGEFLFDRFVLQHPRVCNNCFVVNRETRLRPASRPCDLGDDDEAPVIRPSIQALHADYYPSHNGRTERAHAGERRYCVGCGAYDNFDEWMDDPKAPDAELERADRALDTYAELGLDVHAETFLQIVKGGKFDGEMTGRTHLIYRMATRLAYIVEHTDDNGFLAGLFEDCILRFSIDDDSAAEESALPISLRLR